MNKILKTEFHYVTDSVKLFRVSDSKMVTIELGGGGFLRSRPELVQLKEVIDGCLEDWKEPTGSVDLPGTSA